MQSFKPNEILERDVYKILNASIVPRPIAFVTTLNDDFSLNGAPFSFFNMITANPPLISVSVLRKTDGSRKDTARNIIRNKELAVHITTDENIEKINITSAQLEPNVSEVDLAKLTKVKSELIKTPGINEAKVRFEVELFKHIDLESADLFIGKIINIHLDEMVYQNSYINYDELKPIGRLAGNNFMTASGYKEIIRPK